MTRKLGLLLLFFFPAILFGQARTISGIVTDNANNPLPGVSIVIDGTTIGTVTDVNGNYQINLEPEQEVLNFSFIGFESQRVDVNDQTIINIILESSDFYLDEVVAVGYGGMRKSDISGASVSVSAEQISGSLASSIDQTLQGRAAGVTAITTSGQPGASVSIRIRGQGTLSANAAEPLYVIDGIPVQNISLGGHAIGVGDKLGNAPVGTFGGGLSNINPADIISMEILKDASATAIYGSRGANGVVLITTRRGEAGDAKFEYGFNYGIQEQAKRIKMMDLPTFASYSNSVAEATGGRDPRTEFKDIDLLGKGTDWQDAVFRTAAMQSHQLSASGGTDKTRYYFSGSYLSQDGTVIGSDYERFTGRVNLDADLKNWWTIGTNITLSRVEENLGLNNSEEGIINVALRSSPDIPIYNVDGSWSGDEREGSPGRINPIGKALDEEIRLKRYNITANIFSEIKFIDGLTLRSEASTDIGDINSYLFKPTFQYGSVVNTVNDSKWQFNKNYFWELKNYLTFIRSFNLHNTTFMVGQEASEWSWEYLSGRSTDLTSNIINSPALGEPATMQGQVDSGFGSGAMVSVFSRLNYDFNNKYYFTYTFRYDGSSNFGPENRWAPFHAASVMWRISNEDFWTSLQPYINNLRIRGGWGQTGNSNIGSYKWGAAISRMPTGLGLGYRQTNIANTFVQWESQEMYNLGLDLSFLNSRIDLVVELYHKISQNMLMEMQLGSYMGNRGNESSRIDAPTGNFGEIQNQGLEISLNTRPVVGLVKWDSDLSLTFNKNELKGLTDTPAAHIEGYGQWNDVVSVTRIGESLFGFYGYKVEGIYTSKEDILTSPRPEKYPSDIDNWKPGNNTWVGDIKFKDISGPEGKPDGIIDEYDRTNLGSPWPKFTFGFNNTVSYRNFELNVFINGSYGNKVLNYIGRDLGRMASLWDNQLASAADRTILGPVGDEVTIYTKDGEDYELAWHQDIDNVKIVKMGKNNLPRAVTNDPNNNNRLSDRYIEDGSYLRFKNISLAYYLPSRITSYLGLNSVKIYTNLQNMWTITNYSGLDPEIGASQTSVNVYGLDNGRYPSPRIYSFGINVSF